MNKKIFSALLACTLPLSVSALEIPAQPNTFDYDYLDGGFIDYDEAGSGIFLKGSIDIYPNVNLLGAFVAADDYTEFSLGAGYHSAVRTLSDTDMVFSAGIERGEFDVGGGTIDDSDTGLFLSAGLRASATPALEVFGDVVYHSFYKGDLALDGGMRLRLNEKLDLTAQGTLGDNDAISLGVRYYY